ncbi:MAG TPA: GFA family protein [Gammaproteobacteria bacterium]
MTMHQGGCHCGRVAFTVEGPDELEVSECNCSICRMSGHLHYIVPKSRFELLRGREHLTSYRFNTGVAEHLFCRVCGVKSFYVPRSHPEGVSVNARCISPETVKAVRIVRHFDGANWEQHAHELPPLEEGGSHAR